jgi:uncharacterized phage protein (TIGR01671 family)
MREIKFRAWYEKDKQMLSWSDLHQSAWNSFRGETPISIIYEILVARKHDFEVEQFTGLTDKNGVEIYEGDVAVPYYITPFGELTSGLDYSLRGFVEYLNG